MSRYRQVHTKIWNDDKFPFLQDDTQLTWFHLMTSDYSNAIGLYKASIGALADEKRWHSDRYRDAMKDAIQHGMLMYDERNLLILIRNHWKYNPITSPQQPKSFRNLFDDLPESPLKIEWMMIFSTYIESLPDKLKEAVEEAFGSLLSEAIKMSSGCHTDAIPDAIAIQEQEQEQKQKQEQKEPTRDSVSKIENPIAYDLASFLAKKIIDNKPDYKFKTNWRERWALEIDRMIRLDNRSPPVIEVVIDWCQSDNIPDGNGFCWAHVILSGSNLRKHFDQLEMRMKKQLGTKLFGTRTAKSMAAGERWLEKNGEKRSEEIQDGDPKARRSIPP